MNPLELLLSIFRRPRPPRPTPDPIPIPGDVTAGFLAACNRARASAGVPNLRESPGLTLAADRHALDMAAAGRLGHQGTDGSWPWDRATRAGYHWSRLGENVAAGQRTTPEVMASWLGSRGHRANILDPHTADAGFGVARSAGGTHYWCALFGAPR